MGIHATAFVLAACAGSAVKTLGEQGRQRSGACRRGKVVRLHRRRDRRGRSWLRWRTVAAPAPDQALIVETGSLVLDVTNLDAALARAQAAAAAAGGYVSDSDRSGQGDQEVASVTYRIPAAAWDRVLGAVRALGTRVEKEQTNPVEVTDQVLDLGARITNLKVTQSALQAIMAKATRIADVLAVQQQLTDVQGKIEEITTQKQHLE